MAHPPDVESDLTFEEWIDGIMATPKKGMKLDFKLIDAVSIALKMLGGKCTKYFARWSREATNSASLINF